MVNDTMIRCTPETGYPVPEVRRRARVGARPEGGLPRDRWGQRIVRWLLQGIAGLFFVAAAAWAIIGVSGHVQAWQSRHAAEVAAGELDGSWPAGVTGRPAGGSTPDGVLPPSAAPEFADPVDPQFGQAWGKVHIPAIGLHDAPLYHGTESGQIDVGIGHYVDTEFPWQASGNLGLAGHRTGWDALFGELDELSPGDVVIVETRDAFFEYVVTGNQNVQPEDVWVLTDDPGHVAAASGLSPLVTLTTCEGPNNEMRYVVWGEMVAVYDKASGAAPAALG